MKNKVYTYICVYEHISGEKTTLVFTGTFPQVYKKACKYRPFDCALIGIKQA
jgi:hypothetical protein